MTNEDKKLMSASAPYLDRIQVIANDAIKNESPEVLEAIFASVAASSLGAFFQAAMKASDSAFPNDGKGFQHQMQNRERAMEMTFNAILAEVAPVVAVKFVDGVMYQDVNAEVTGKETVN